MITAEQKIVALMEKRGLVEAGRMIRRQQKLRPSKVGAAAVALLNDAEFLKRITKPRPAKSKRDQIEMVDGRVYFSDDNWTTVWRMRRGTSHRIVTGEEADTARFIAVAKESASADG